MWNADYDALLDPACDCVDLGILRRSSERRLAPVAVSAQSPTPSKVDMLVATSRLATDNPSTMFGGERAPKPSLTDITISIPADATRKAGEV
jgi:esterase/lipase superfamily enzyme